MGCQNPTSQDKCAQNVQKQEKMVEKYLRQPTNQETFIAILKCREFELWRITGSLNYELY